MAKEGNERGENTHEVSQGDQVLAGKIQRLFEMGASFPYGQPQVSGITRSAKIEYNQAVLSGCKVVDAIDGKAWIGFKLDNGLTCKTTSKEEAAKLRMLVENPGQKLGQVDIRLEAVRHTG